MTSSAPRCVPRIHIVGRKNAGKTTLVCDLVTELSRREYRVATIKHTHHHHELDTPGKDSHKHRISGAAGVGILSPQMTAAFLPADRASDADPYEGFSVLFRNCDLILVEGDLQTDAMKIEVWRNVLSEQPYAVGDASISFVVTDDSITCKERTLKTVPRSDVASLAGRIIELIKK